VYIRKPLQFLRQVSIQSLVRTLHSSRVNVRGGGSKDEEIKKNENYFSLSLKNSPINSCPENINTYTFNSHLQPPPPPPTSSPSLHTRSFLGTFCYRHCTCVHLLVTADSTMYFRHGNFYLDTSTCIWVAQTKALIIQQYFILDTRTKCINPLNNQSEVLKRHQLCLTRLHRPVL
jgi:hypothetical protein